MVKLPVRFGARLPKCCETPTIAAYPAAQRAWRSAGASTCASTRTHYLYRCRRSIPRAHIPRGYRSIATRTTDTSAGSSMQQQTDAGWSREAIDEAIGSGSLDHLLHWIGTTERYNAAVKARDILIARAQDPLVIQGIISVLSEPVKSSNDFCTACAGLRIVRDLPLATLRLYRSGLETLAASTEDSPPGVSLPSLRSGAEDAIQFIDSPELAWAPQYKTDYMAERSLAERVHTAQQMKPYAMDLLGWLADLNWPPYLGCVKQLARFPEVAVDPIKEIIADNRDDPEWLLHILYFVEDSVPIGVLWEKLEPELSLLASSEAEDKLNRDLAEVAQSMLGLLSEWKKEQVGNE
ncbi:uncharacterized protein Triagg1_10221 [Trichoderma aggressivum f. europaeum]|uniref:DUF5071 domain-containing protein n=1 Tax=Trichoderma aggressivum f. europaeum TaxID=173218 RepID=A0AAE1I5X8_9HYPO|nr:hypothetical protein Triagg1_10221 [Trichoderma aggressivum f. europaeum]